MARIARKTKRYPSDLTDEEWERIAPLMPEPGRWGRPREVEFREVINAVRYLVRSGCGWRMLPVHFGRWRIVCKRWGGVPRSINVPMWRVLKHRYRGGEIVAKRRQVDVLVSQGRPVAEVIRAIRVTAFTYCRWRKEFGGLKSDQVKRLKELEKENERLRKAVSDLTLEKLILKEAAAGNF